MECFEFSLRAVDGLTLRGRGWRPGTTPRAVVCLLHGLGEHGGRYSHLAEALVSAGYAFLAPDLRGHGRSEGRRGHAPSYAALMDDTSSLLAEAEVRFPETPRFLYGHSLGGNLVLNYPLRRRPSVDGVIATAPWLRLAFDPPSWKMLLGRTMDRLWPAFSLPTGLDVADYSHDPEIASACQADPLMHDRVSARLGIGLLEAGAWALAHAAEFPLPLLLMHGGADRITSAEASREFASRVSAGCTFSLWDGLSHEIHNEVERGEILTAMVSWLDSVGDALVVPNTVRENVAAAVGR